MLADLLIDHGADVNQEDDYRQTPLHYTGHKATAALLIERGADIYFEISQITIVHAYDTSPRFHSNVKLIYIMNLHHWFKPRLLSIRTEIAEQ